MLITKTQYIHTARSVRFEDSISKLLARTSTYSIVLLHAQSSYGLTSLLGQLADEIKSKTLAIQVQTNLDLKTFLSELFLISANKIDSPNSTLDFLLLQLVHYLNFNNLTLLIDDVHLVLGCETLISYCTKNLATGKLIATSHRKINLPVQIQTDIYNYVHEGFSDREGLELMARDQSIVPQLPSEAVQELSKLLINRSKRNPVLFKLYLNQAISELAPYAIQINIENISQICDKIFQDKSLLEAQLNYWNSISSKISPDDLLKLKKLSLLKFPTRLSATLYGSLSETTKFYCELLGYVSVGSTTFVKLTSYFTDLNLSGMQQSEVNSMREAIIGELEIDDKLETIWQLKQLGKNNEAVAALNGILDRNSKRIPELENSHTVLSITEHLKNLPFKALNLRIEALRNTNQNEKCIVEIMSLLPTASEEETAKLHYHLAKIYHFMGDSEAAEKSLHTLIQMHSDSSPIFIYCRRLLAHIEYFRNPPLALEMLMAIYNQVHAKGFAVKLESTFIGNLEYSISFAYQLLENPELALKHINASISSLEANYSIVEALEAKRSKAALLYDAFGKVEESLSILDEIESTSLEYNSSSTYYSALATRVFHLRMVGKIFSVNETENNFRSETNRYDLRARSNIQLLQAIALANLSVMKFEKCESLLKECLSYNAVKNDPALFAYYSLRVELLEHFRSANLLELQIEKSFEAHTLKRELHFLMSYVFCLEINHLSMFPLTLKSILEWKPQSKETERDVDYKVSFQILRGIHLVKLGNLERGREQLTRGLSEATLYKHPLWQARANIYLTLLDLNQNELTRAVSELSQAKDQAAQTDGTPEFELIPILESALALRHGDSGNIEKIMNGKSFTVFSYLASRLYPKLGQIQTSTHASKLHQDWIYEFIKIGHDPFVRLSTHKGDQKLRLSALPKLTKKDYDIVIHHLDTTVTLEGKPIDFSQKHTLLEFFEFLVRHPLDTFTKEELTQKVWREKYNPIVHDSRIYTTVKRLRSLTPKDWIRTQGDRYGILPTLKFAIIETHQPESELSERKQWIIKYLREHSELDRSKLCEILKISPTLAKNELRELIDLGWITSSGKARITRYHLKPR